MKIVIGVLLFGLVALASARPQLEDQRPERPAVRPPRPGHPMPDMSPELREFVMDIKDFFRLYPKKEIRRIVREHWQDAELQAVMAYVRTTNFHETIHAIVETPEFQNIIQYLKDADWPWIHKVMDDMTKEVEMMGRSLVMSKHHGGGLAGLLDDIIAVLPKEQLHALFLEKVNAGGVFAAVVEIFSSAEFRDLISAAGQSEFLRTQYGILHENGIDISKLMEYQRALFGF